MHVFVYMGPVICVDRTRSGPMVARVLDPRQSDQSLCLSLEHSMIVKLLTEHHLEFLSLKGGCRGSSESTHVKMSNCWKSHATTHMIVTASVTSRLVLIKNAINYLSVCRR